MSGSYDDLEILAGRIEAELADGRQYLTRRLMAVLDMVCTNDRQHRAAAMQANQALTETFEVLKAAEWAWCESLRRFNGREPSRHVDAHLDVAEWNPNWKPEIADKSQ